MPFHQVRRDPAFLEAPTLPDVLSIPCSQGLSCKTTPTGLNVSLEEGARVEPLSVAVQSVGHING
ncbi:hypothetical protein BT69DRAFT_1277442 [Atractiella rhizophila]|nr:hypothetical protein BT69DRAFT_1277442 [Atractiella rhizophila]